MRKVIQILIFLSILAGNVPLLFAADFVGCVKIAQGEDSEKVECFEVFHQPDVQNLRNIQTIIEGSAKGDEFRFIKSKDLYHLVQFNPETSCLSVHRMTLNLEKLETFSMPCGLVPASDLQGTMDQKGNMFLALSGHDQENEFSGKLTVIKMGPQGEFRIFPVLLNSTLYHPQAFRNLKIAISEYSHLIHVAYVQAGIDDEFGTLHIAALDSTTGAVKNQSDFNFHVSAAVENIQLVTNHLGQTFAVLGGINDEGAQGIFSMQEEFAGTWSLPELIRSGAQTPQLTLLDSDLIYMTSKGVQSQEMWLDILSGQAKGIINTLNYSESLAMNLPSLGDPAQFTAAPDASEVLKQFSSGTDETVLIGLERKI